MTCCTAPAAKCLRLFECSRWLSRCGTSQTTAQYTPEVALAWSSVAQLEAHGQMANCLRDLSQPILALHMDGVTILTMSEFGRTARENGNRGTDHGHGNDMFVVGCRVRGADGCMDVGQGSSLIGFLRIET